MASLRKRPLFNPEGDIDVTQRRLIGGNTTNMNDFNNLKYTWTSDWYRQAMNNFWIPEEINLGQDVKDYRQLPEAERRAYDKILSFLVFLDSVQSANLPNVSAYITANEVDLCLTIQSFQECVHSQSYSYMLDTIASPDERQEIIFQWKDDAHLLARNTFIGDLYNEFQQEQSRENFLRVLVANYILEGIYFYSGFMFFYNLGRIGRMPGSVQEIRYINRDENTHLWLFRNILRGGAGPLHGGERGDDARDDPRGRAPGNRLGQVRHRQRGRGPQREDDRGLRALPRQCARGEHRPRRALRGL